MADSSLELVAESATESSSELVAESVADSGSTGPVGGNPSPRGGGTVRLGRRFCAMRKNCAFVHRRWALRHVIAGCSTEWHVACLPIGSGTTCQFVVRCAGTFQPAGKFPGVWVGGVGPVETGRMWMDSLINSGTLPVLEKVAAFTEGRHRVLAENIANIDTPGYRTKQLDPKLFQAELARAVENHRGRTGSSLGLRSTKQFHTDDQGRLNVTPTLRPSQNILFHDGTNASVEHQMTALAENTIMHQVVVELMQQRFNGLRGAISGRVM